MKVLLFVLGIGVGTVAIGTRTEAQDYPWCASFADGAGTNCGFTSYEQCMGTARGTGGYCEKNNLYKPPAAAPTGGHRVRHKAHARS
jgi:hypothetical protein